MMQVLRTLVLRADGFVRLGAEKLQRLLRWSRGASAARTMRLLAVLAATPGAIAALPLYAAVPLLLALLVLAIRQEDNATAEAAVAALLRLIILIVAGGAALLLLLAPSFLHVSVAAAGVLSALGEYVHDLEAQ